MDPGDPRRMTPSNSYPSPTAPSSASPFYPQQTPAERGSHPHAPTAPMQGGEIDGSSFAPPPAAAYGQTQLSTPVQQLAQQGLNMNQNNSQLDSEPAKKKQKVSRACDECRRKKIKCDAVEGDSASPTCSACARSETHCTFSRAPQKRGPSKGYIKDLAERVHLLEQNKNENSYHPAPGFPADVNTYSPSPDFMGLEPRRRTHSMIDGPHAFTPTPDQLQTFGRGYTPNMSSSNMPLQDGTSFAYPGGFEPLRNLGTDAEALSTEPLDIYYREIHIYFPILPDSKAEFLSTLENVGKPVKDGTLAAVHAAIQQSTSGADSKPFELAKRALLQAEELTDRNHIENLVVLQAYLLMIIAREVSGPGKNTTEFYGLARHVAIHLKLHHNEEVDTQESSETVSAKINGRRAWLTLAVLDRWQAAGMATPLVVDDQLVQLRSSDRKLLGERAYNLFSISISLGHVVRTITLPQFQLKAHAANLEDLEFLYEAIKGEFDRFHDIGEAKLPSIPHVHLAYLTARLLADRHVYLFRPATKDIMIGAFTIVKLLSNEQNHVSPLSHHFAALAAITLGEVLEHDPSKISNALKDLQNSLDNSAVQYPHVAAGNRPAWNTAVSQFISSRLDSQNHHSEDGQRDGLQDLANAAVGVDGSRPGEETGKKLESQMIDWTAMVRAGYLSLFH